MTIPYIRTPDYLSPTSVAQFHKDREEYYRKYLGAKMPRMAQTEPMSVGSAFDAYVKNYLAVSLGMSEATSSGEDSLDLDYLLTHQVEEANREFAYEAGKHCFLTYKRLGACAELMKELESGGNIKFESTVRATMSTGVEGLPDMTLMGKPDLYFYNKDGELVIIDWKVNGYCSKSGASPRKGFVRMLASKGGQLVKTCHKDAQPMLDGGLILNVAAPLDTCDPSWAAQVGIYGWVLNATNGRDPRGAIIAGIDQLACKPASGGVAIRVASQRSRISLPFQAKLWDDCIECWAAICNGTVVSDTVRRRLDLEVAAFESDGSVNDEWFNSTMRKHRW